MKISDNPIIYMTRKMWKYSEGNRKMVLLYFAMFAVSNTLSLLKPVLVAILLNTVQQQGITAASVNYIIFIASLFVVLELAFWAFHGPARIIEQNNAFRARANYRKHMLEGTMNLPLKWHSEHHSGDTIDKIEKGASAVFHYSSESFRVISLIMGLVMAFAILTYFSLNSAFIIAVLTAVCFLIIIKFDRFLLRKYLRIYQAENSISARVFDAISNITTIIVLRLEKITSSSLYRKILSPFGIYARAIKIDETKWFLVSLVGTIMLVLVIIVYIIDASISGSVVLVGTLYILYGYIQRIHDSFFEFASLYGNIIKWKAALHNSKEISSHFQRKPKVEQIDLSKPWNTMKISGLSFHYHDDEGDLHLNNISLEIKNGEKIALVGESGGGKTTFLKLIRALYKPKHVHIEIDGQRVESFDSIADSMTLLPQDPELFDATVKENITMGLPTSMGKIRKYAEIARFDKVAKKLPRKYNSHIKEKGVNLSTGEKQRLALTRGLLAAEASPIILLDEPTSSIDSTNEMAVYTNIFREFKDRTIISSIHRLHLLSLFDKIYVFKGGKIVASGTLEEIMKSREFAAMWRKYMRKTHTK